MITRTATLISLAGILVAGSAAAVVNTQVLQGADDATGSQPSVLATQLTSTTSSTVPATTATAVPVTAGTAPGTGGSATISAYAVGDAGVVSLDASGGVLTLASAVPNPGWVVSSSGTNGFGGVRIHFRSATAEVKFNAVLTGGEVVTSVDAELLTDHTGTSLGEATGTTIDDHGGDDDHSDDISDDISDDNSGHDGSNDDGSDDHSDDGSDDHGDDSSDDSGHDGGDDDD